MNPRELDKISKREKCLILRGDCDITKFKCLKCDTDFSSLKTLHSHMFSIHAEKRLYYKCPVCDYTFAQVWCVGRHLMRVHKKTKEETDLLKAEIKSTFLAKPGNMKSHNDTVSLKVGSCADFQKLECLGCSKSFSTPANLRQHVARHLGLTRFLCKLCGLKTFNHSDCQNHVKRIHDVQDPQQFIVTCNK
ncbi:uncharacterized protein NPIL_308871 [Nephila pilipes]|uniref:C2H2-type domain-containing protein n=1 Tax=Nephila pilipes TaxID=299642 RepID=A0A8X6TXG4_NEPPI|nr:uncharacterized protein NPIL_308871 [Nephila pilipes]